MMTDPSAVIIIRISVPHSWDCIAILSYASSLGKVVVVLTRATSGRVDYALEDGIPVAHVSDHDDYNIGNQSAGKRGRLWYITGKQDWS